jgi:hypothetical protein
VAYACNPSYSAGRDQEDGGSKLAPGKQSGRPYLKNILQKNRAGRVVQSEGSEYKPQYPNISIFRYTEIEI